MLHTLFQWFVKITGLIPELIIFRTKVCYEDKTTQKRHIRSKAIVVSNHNGLMDFGILLFVFFSRTLRCAVAEVTFRRNLFVTAFMKLVGCIEIDRDSLDLSYLDRLKGILDRGGVVEIYPEGRIPQKGEEKPIGFKPGYVHLSLESGAPIIPIYNNGKAFSTKRAKVVIGCPIDVSELYDSTLSEKENVRNINDHIRSKIIELGKNLEE